MTEDMEYFAIDGPQEMNMKVGLFLDRVRFWRDILANDINHKLRDQL